MMGPECEFFHTEVWDEAKGEVDRRIRVPGFPSGSQIF